MTSQGKATSMTVQPKFSDVEKMHAIVWKGKYSLDYATVPKPLVTDPKDVLVKVTATTICGSDLHLYSGDMPAMKSGDIIGHECMGIIEDVGSDVKKLKKGQRVVVSFNVACGDCDYCRRGETTGCDTTNPSVEMEQLYGHRTAALFGYSHLTGGLPGCQAEYVRVPFGDNNCLPIPDDVPDEKALFLSDIACTSYHATELGEVREGCSVAVWGCGPVGALTLQWCKLKGAKIIIGIDVVPERLQMIHDTLGGGNIITINAHEVDVLEELRRLVPGGLDVVIEAAGFRYASDWKHKIERTLMMETDTSEILTQCITAVRKFGNLSIIGDYMGTTNHFPIGAMMEKHITVRGGQATVQAHWQQILEKMRSGSFDPMLVVNYKGKLSETPKLYKQFFNKENGLMKVFLRP